MSGTYLTGLADWLRAGGLRVIEYDGWKTRARSSGGYASGRPFCVMWHHTASPASWDGKKDADYIARGDSASPVSNLYIQRDGTVWVIAAGATNTNGKGNATTFSKGTVPTDQMNTHAVGVEMGNNGVGEPWPQAQVDAMFKVSNIVNARCGNQPSDVCTHNKYAPTRKIDPATAAAVQGAWRPRSVNSSGTWSCDDIVAECRKRAGDSGGGNGGGDGGDEIAPEPEPEPTPPPTEDDEMALYCYSDDNGTFWLGNGVTRWPLASMEDFDNRVVLSNTGGGPRLLTTNGKQVRQSQDVAHGTPAMIGALGKYG